MAKDDENIKIGITTTADTKGAEQAQEAVEDLDKAVEEMGKDSQQAADQARFALEELKQAAEAANQAKIDDLFDFNIDSVRGKLGDYNSELRLVNANLNRLALTNVTLGRSQQTVIANTQTVTGNWRQMSAIVGGSVRSISAAGGALGGFGQSIGVLLPMLGAGGLAGLVAGLASTLAGSLVSSFQASAKEAEEFDRKIKEMTRDIQAAAQAEAVYASQVAFAGKWDDESASIRDLIANLKDLRARRIEEARTQAILEDNEFKLREIEIEDSDMSQADKVKARYQLTLERTRKEYERALKDNWGQIEEYDIQLHEAYLNAKKAREEEADYEALGESLLSNTEYKEALKRLEELKKAEKAAGSSYTRATVASDLSFGLFKGSRDEAMNNLHSIRGQREEMEQLISKHNEAAIAAQVDAENSDAYAQKLDGLTKSRQSATEAADRAREAYERERDAFVNREKVIQSNQDVQTRQQESSFNKDLKNAEAADLQRELDKRKEKEAALQQQMKATSEGSDIAAKALEAATRNIGNLEKALEQLSSSGDKAANKALSVGKNAMADGQFSDQERKQVEGALLQVQNMQKSGQGQAQTNAMIMSYLSQILEGWGNNLQVIAQVNAQLAPIQSEIAAIKAEQQQLQSQIKNSR